MGKRTVVIHCVKNNRPSLHVERSRSLTVKLYVPQVNAIYKRYSMSYLSIHKVSRNLPRLRLRPRVPEQNTIINLHMLD